MAARWRPERVMGFGSSAAQRENFERMMKGYNPLSWWKFIESSGTSLSDSGSDPHAATLNLVGTTGSLGVSTGPAVSSRKTNNNALRYTGGGASGVPAAASVASSAGLYQLFGTSATLTIGAFIKVVTAGTSGFTHFPTKQSTPGFRLTITNSSRSIGAGLFDGTQSAFTGSTVLPTDGAWHMACCVINRSVAGANGTGTFQYFMDGVQTSLNNLPTGFGSCNDSSSNMSPVQSNNTPDAVYDISDIFIINQVLTTTQIRALYKAGTR